MLNLVKSLAKRWKSLGPIAGAAGAIILLFEAAAFLWLIGFGVHDALEGKQSRESDMAIFALAAGFGALFLLTFWLYPLVAAKKKKNGLNLVIGVILSAVLLTPPQAYSAGSVKGSGDEMIILYSTGEIPAGAEPTTLATFKTQAEAEAAAALLSNGGWSSEWGAKPQAIVPCAIVVVVVVVAGVVVYKLVSFCRAHFPPPPGTNAPSTNSLAAFAKGAAALLASSPQSIGAGDSNVYVAMFVIASPPAGLMPPGVALNDLSTVDLGFSLDESNGLAMSGSSRPVPDAEQFTLQQYWDGLLATGLALPASSAKLRIGDAYYSMNGSATSNSPISLINGQVSVTYADGPPSVPVILWRSSDFISWTPFATNSVSPGHSVGTISYEPTAQSRMYYRATTAKP